MDFVKCLENDMVVNIFKCLDPADVVRACVISPNWRDFIIGNEVSKQLCLREFPQVADIVDVRENEQMMMKAAQKRKHTDDVGNSEGELVLSRNHKAEGDLIRSRNHKVYASLLHVLRKLKHEPVDCKERKLSVSSYPSKGLKDDSIPKTLIFKLKHDECVITEIYIKPYREYLKGIQLEKQDYSAKSVRFRMGFPKPGGNKVIDALTYARRFEAFGLLDKSLSIAPSDFTWTYTSPEFPINRKCQRLARGGRVQKFKFAEPVLCIGGYLMVELLGRVQMDEKKGPYCVKVANVDVLGRSLSPAFKAEPQGHSGKFVLNYDASRLSDTLKKPEITEPRTLNQRYYGNNKVTVCACACSDSIEL